MSAICCWKMIWRMSGNNPFKDIFTITDLFICAHGCMKMTDILHVLIQQLCGKCPSLHSHLCTQDHSPNLRVVNFFCPQTRHHRDFIFLAIFSDAHKQQVSDGWTETGPCDVTELAKNI